MTPSLPRAFGDAALIGNDGKLLGICSLYVRTREHSGRTLSYIAGWHAIAEANRIFGFDGWDRETVSASCIWQGRRNGQAACTYVARVRIAVRAGGAVITRDGSGHGRAATQGEAHERPSRRPRPTPPCGPWPRSATSSASPSMTGSGAA